MSIKSLLLGSAAALAAVSGAHAADAIVAAEPEPLEYVRICDAYGAGYFYIPGTETCLKIGGKVRTEGEWYNAYAPGGGTQGTLWHTRAELQIQTATDTEYGALKTNNELRWDWQEGGSTATNLLHASISLGGFTIGKEDSAYNVFTGYAGDVINDDVVYDGPYELNQATYNYDAGNGFTAVVSLEDSNSGYTGTTTSVDPVTGALVTTSVSNAGANGESGLHHYAPDAVLGVGYKAGAFGFKVVGGYDSLVKEGAIKARIDADFGGVQAFLMGGWNTDGSKLNKYAGANGSGAASGIGWGDWAVWGGLSAPINDKWKAAGQVAYTDSKILAATANLQFHPVKNLLIQPEVSYTHWDSIDAHSWAGILRFQRSF